MTVRPKNAAKFILEDQYLLAQRQAGNDNRIDALGTLGEQVIGKLLAGSLPVPSELARDLGPLVAENRLLVWTTDPAEQDLLDRIGMLGALPEMGDDGGFGFTVVNGGNSKIDVFLERETDVRIETGPDGQRLLVADVTLTNGAPAGGLPPYVIGNTYGLPDGTSRMLVTMYGPSSLRSLLVDGEPVEYDVNAGGGLDGLQPHGRRRPRWDGHVPSRVRTRCTARRRRRTRDLGAAAGRSVAVAADGCRRVSCPKTRHSR